ncbi:PIG-L family deacetylase [Hymenobacter sp. ASUV-10]|uniref:PIG-L family deacetylase n=1 Tax=Hymenobacter aranciens TaxID=3063996 RepID=A0ABT9BDC9_9BACT|nr:PIG-L family deacetylase [Hymenobacter sp. ASUV-10]MDO7876271.1 PIG-L family deacetylase [Hymenobacter sp. ASUV-10]
MRFLILRLAAALLLANCSLFIETKAQAPKTYTSSEILLGLKKLNVLGSVLYIAAHPDDENTRLLAYLANERLLETAYLSCTRGDGGQNLIGPELREQLGVIRTQELLAARRIDGASQFFTRANDFGFSKTSDETFTIWDKEQVLADMVWVIRQRRPDVLITRFPPDARAGHGHHQASAILAIEAFAAAGDAKRFPEQLQYVQPWQPKRLLWNTGSFFVKPGEDLSGFLKLDAGGYNPLLGKSYGELASLSRSQHRSQGMGTAAQRGESLEYFQTLRPGDVLPKELFEGVDMTWNRVSGGAEIGKKIEDIIQKYNASEPEASVTDLLAVQAALRKVPAEPSGTWGGGFNFWRDSKEEEVQTLLQACQRVYVGATTPFPTVVPGQRIPVDFEITNQSKRPVTVMAAGPMIPSFADGDSSGIAQKVVQPGQQLRFRRQVTISKAVAPSQPYWLQLAENKGMYRVPEYLMVAQRSPDATPSYAGSLDWIRLKQQKLIGTPDNPGAIPTLALLSSGAIFGNVQYKHTDPVLGELYQPLAVVPPVAVNLPAARAYVFADAQPKAVPVTLRAGRAGVKGTLALRLPAGWQAEPARAAFDLATKDAEQTLNFQLRPLPGATPGKAEVQAVATVDGQDYARGLQTISYPHIPTQTLFPEATAPLVKLNVSRGKAQTVGYLMGAGDEVPEALRQLGYTVTLLDPATDLTLDRLRRYDAVVLGIRAYNTVEKLKSQQAELFKYAEQGGTVVVQYVVTRGVLLPQIGPYPLTLSNNRITVENTPVKFLNPQHPLLNAPNKLTPEDFSTGWVQEQGLYYPSAWDAKYTPLIASHDPGEADQQSAILVAAVGKGHYIYTGLSLFRELPAGVPGAYRVLANLVSYGK